jgi:phenylpropionate dioxygenase-like ring-hydroxylating dioxygenase large terminal subunit
MQITTTYSKSGKTMYHAVQVNESTTIKAQSKKMAAIIVELLTADSVVELVKMKRNWFLHINSVYCGRITKTDFTKLTNTKNENNQTAPESQLSVPSGEESSSEWEIALLPSRSGERIGIIDFIRQSGEDVQGESQFLAYLEQYNSQLQNIESNGSPLEKRLASIRRGQIEVALGQRGIKIDQQRIGEQQQRIGEHQQRIGEHQQRIGEHQQRIGDSLRSFAKRLKSSAVDAGELQTDYSKSEATNSKLGEELVKNTNKFLEAVALLPDN